MDSEVARTARSPIQEFYAGTKIFITGGTGFLGRILVEKLLRSCPDVSKIYLLVRQKKGLDVNSRLNELFKDEIFNTLRLAQPDFREKIVGIFGDCIEPNLGIKEEDLELLIEEINIVFHAAATVNFDEKLHKATLINIRSTRDVLNLARKMKKLKFITHVSTAYSHCYSLSLNEEFYKATHKAENIITLVENLPENTIEKITATLLEQYPNSYAFTKSISEDLLEQSNDLPIAVCRPAIIVSTYREPVAGWINNLYGPQGVSTAAMVGLLRSLYCDENVDANIVPVDMCVNALIAIPWDAREKYEDIIEHNKTAEQKKTYDVPIYNYESSSYQPLNWKRFRNLTQYYGLQCPSVQMIGIYFFHLNKHKSMHTLYTWFLHLLPAILVDTCLTCVGKKPMLYKAYEKVHRFSDVISYFCTKNFNFKSNRVGQLCENMSEEDRDIFFCDLGKLSWEKFFKSYLSGCRVYLLKDPLHTIPAGIKHFSRIKIYTFIILAILVLLLLWFLNFSYNLIFTKE